MGGLGKHISQRDREYFETHGQWYPDEETDIPKERLCDNKKDILAKAVEYFKDSVQTKDDYMDLFIAVHRSLRQGSGLVWSQIDEILEEVLN